MIETLTLALVLIPALVVAIVFHEVAHGYAARALGDPTASERGRLTLNPLRHVDPVGTLLVPGALALAGGPVFGWAKPVPVNQMRLANPRFGMMAVAAAGPLSNFVLATLGALVLGLTMPRGLGFGGDETAGLMLLTDGLGETAWLATGLFYFILVNTFLGLFNLLPIPPFDGSHIVGGLLPPPLRRVWGQLQGLGVVLIVVLIAASWVFGTSWLSNVLMPPVMWVLGLFLGLADLVAGLG
jgi:Zn-dependent protease